MSHYLTPLLVACLISPSASAWTIYVPEQGRREMLTAATDASADTALRMELRLGQREDDFSYRIGYDNPGPQRPDVLSELDWHGMQLVEVGIRLHDPRPGWSWAVEASHARSYDGTVRDSDWAEAGRQQEFSRSVATTEGSTTGDVLFGFGYRQSVGEHLALVPAIGVEQHRLHWRMRHAVQVLSEPNPFIPDEGMPPVGLRYDARSHFRANYRGAWLGLGLVWTVLPGLRLEADWRRSRYDYRGAGNWALRSDLAHPESHRQDSEGMGDHAQVAVRYRRREGEFGLHYSRRDWSTKPGSKITFGAAGGSGEIRLNDVAWRSEVVSLSWSTDW